MLLVTKLWQFIESHWPPGWRKPLANAELLTILIQRDLSARYQGSILGNLWPLINQLAQLLVYTYVFAVVLQVKLNLQGGEETSPAAFGLWLFAGLVPWIALSTALIQSCVSVKNQPNLVKKVIFPLSLLPLVPVGVSFIESTFGLVLLLAFAVLFLGKVYITVFLLPIVWLVQLLLTTGLSYWGAGLTVFLRDIPQVVAVGLNLWFYATPIIYPSDLIPQAFVKWVFWLNPLAAIVEMYRDLILIGTITHWADLGVSFALSILIFLSGFWIYQKIKPGFADIL